MTARFFAGVLLAALVAAVLLLFFHRQLAGLGYEVYPEMDQVLREYRDDLRQWGKRDPELEAEYRQRFEGVQQLLARLGVLELNKNNLLHLSERILLGVFIGSVALALAAYLWRQHRQERRLGRLGTALGDLAEGRTDLQLGERRRDAIGRVANMVERTSRAMARDRRRLAALKNLSTWQEAARRHAHEMKTPLAAARLEITRLDDLLRDAGLSGDGNQAVDSALQELDRLTDFTRRFTSFARLPSPRLEAVDLEQWLRHFVSAFDGAWGNLTLALAPVLSPPETIAESHPYRAKVDREMLRQVLVNLCDNSALALGAQQGHMTFRLRAESERVVLEVSDDGPGVALELADRVFEPYTTSRRIGEGMGLGLAIAKKILLDHGGDLELVHRDEPGATFRLSLQRAPAQHADARPAESAGEGETAGVKH